MVLLCCESDPPKPEGEGLHGSQQSYSSFISFRILILSLYLSWFLWEHSFHLQQEQKIGLLLFRCVYIQTALPKLGKTILCVTEFIIYFNTAMLLHLILQKKKREKAFFFWNRCFKFTVKSWNHRLLPYLFPAFHVVRYEGPRHRSQII